MMKKISINLIRNKELYECDEELWDIAIEEVNKYNGILIADCNAEDNEMEYLRIREGKEKKVKIVEED